MVTTDEWRRLVTPATEGRTSGTTVLALVKFGSEKHMRDLLEHGRIFMQTLDAFQRIEDGQVRGDALESAAVHLQSNELVLTFGEMTIKPESLAGPVTISYTESKAIHVFCMTAITDGALDGSGVLHDQVRSFGSHAVVVYDFKRFRDRFIAAVQAQRLHGAMQLVRYLDTDSHHGSMSVFNKSSSYEWQSEYRFVMEPSGDSTFVLALGSLEDVAKIVPVSELLSWKLSAKPRERRD